MFKMDICRIQDAYKNLVNAIKDADEKGYEYSHAPLTEDLRALIPKIINGTLESYVTLVNPQGVTRCFTETIPENCASLNNAYAYFVDVIEGKYEDSNFLETMSLLESRFNENRKNWGLEQ